MKISFELDAEFREDQGKGASRRLRHLGKVPAILYGGKHDARALLVDHTKLAQLMDNERFYSTILALKVGSQQRSEEHTSELQSQSNLVCRLLLEKKKKKQQ